MHPHYKDKYEILTVTILDIKPLKNVLKNLKYVSDEIELSFNYSDQDKSMNIFADNVSIKMYAILKSDYFTKFVSKTKNIIVRVNIGESICGLDYFDNNCEVNLSIIVDNKSRKYLRLKSENTEYKYELLDDRNDVYLTYSQKIICNDSYVLINSANFLKKLQDFSKIAWGITIKYSEKGFIFECNSKSEFIQIKYDDVKFPKEGNIFALESVYNIKNLMHVINCGELSTNVKMRMQSDRLCIRYDIGNFGKVVTFLKPV